MNIESNLGMALFSTEPSAAAATGNTAGQFNGPAEGSEGSLFQQLISQMMTANKQMTEMQGEKPDSMAQDKAGESGNLLSELLLAGGNLAKFRLWSAEEAGESMPTDGQTTDQLLSIAAGFGNPMQAGNMNGELSEPQVVKTGTEVMPSEIGSVQRTGSEFETPENPEQKYIPVNSATRTGDSMEEKAVQTNQQLAEPEMMSATGNGKAALKESSAAEQQGETAKTLTSMTGSEKTAPFVPKGNEFLRTEYSGPVNGKSENPETTAGQNFKLAEPENRKQTVAADSQMTAAGLRSNSEEDAIGAAEKAIPEIEMKGTGVDRTGFQNTILGAAAARETAEAVLPGRPIETAQPYSQIRDEILTKLDQSGPTEFKMQLDPEDLGQIDIKLKFSEGKLTIDILALNAKTQALLTGQVDKLIASMGLQNVVVESVQVNQQMSAQTQDNSQGQGYTMNTAMDFSQRKQQEQFQQQFRNDGRLTGTHNRQPEDMQTGSQTSRTESMRYGFHRMNYAV